MKINYENNIYIIDRDFHLVEFDKAVEKLYPGIKVGDICYKAVMNRDTPCAHCPIADCSDNPSVVYYDSLYDGFVEADFCVLTGGKYCVTRHKVGVETEHMKTLDRILRRLQPRVCIHLLCGSFLRHLFGIQLRKLFR